MNLIFHDMGLVPVICIYCNKYKNDQGTVL